MRSGQLARIAGPILAPLLALGVVTAQGSGVAYAAPATGSHHHGILYVSPKAKASGADRSCGSAAFKTIQSAVDAAPPSSTVVVCRGVYHEQVVVRKPLSLEGRHATIDETGVTPTLTVPVVDVGNPILPTAVAIFSSNVRVSGFTITGAQGEGIVAAGTTGIISNILIRQNVVVNNDLGVGKNTFFECISTPGIPGDCGEAVHFIKVAYSRISRNYIAHNSGGVLLSDDLGPTHNILVDGNVVTENASDCGITVPGHNPQALNAAGQRQPSKAGVYDNVIWGNVVTRNGLKGEGAGVLFANAVPGSASYNNLVAHNYIADNELAGVTMHAHTLAPGQFEDLSGNKVIDNTIGTNNLGGDPLDSPASPQDLRTTGVLVFSGGTPVQVTVAHNFIFKNHFGIWLSKPVKAKGLQTNSFHKVTVRVSPNN